MFYLKCKTQKNKYQYKNVRLSTLGIVWGLFWGDIDPPPNSGNIKKWKGVDLTYKINTSTQISFFSGSQKGGLVCANGICAIQPGFEDGYKVTFRSLF